MGKWSNKSAKIYFELFADCWNGLIVFFFGKFFCRTQLDFNIAVGHCKKLSDHNTIGGVFQQRK